MNIAVIGAGVSGLTSAVVLAERGYPVSIFAHETGQQTTSGAAAAIWFPYDCEPKEKVMDWGLTTYRALVDLSQDASSGVSMLELRTFSRRSEIQIPDWANALGATVLPTNIPSTFKSGFTMKVPLTDTTRYLDYLTQRVQKAGGSIHKRRFDKLEDVDLSYGFIINCAGFGAKTLVNDPDLEPHRGQVAIVPKIDNLNCAIVCDDAPLMYAIPRTNDCVFGGTNELSEDRHVDHATTGRILAECTRALNIDKPEVLAERVGLRPFRQSGVRLERERSRDSRTVIHNYGHGGAGFTLSWGCAAAVGDLV